jgi:hypothetical protein
VADLFQAFKEAPAAPVNSAPRSGSVNWVRGLKQRIQEPMEKLQALNNLVMETDEAKEILKLYTSLTEQMGEHEQATVTLWCTEIEATSEEKLKQSLILRQPGVHPDDASVGVPHCVSPTVSPPLCLPHCVSLTVSPSLCLPHCVSPTVSPSLCLPHCVSPTVPLPPCLPHCVSPAMSPPLCHPQLTRGIQWTCILTLPRPCILTRRQGQHLTSAGGGALRSRLRIALSSARRLFSLYSGPVS